MKIGILREGKVPPDTRVPLTPEQCARIIKAHPNVSIVVEPSPLRAFSDAEYLRAGVLLSSNLSDCDLILGVKEVPLLQLRPQQRHLFFSHTHKGQAYNRPLLKEVIDKKITLLDYELLTNENGERLIAFGYYAGVVGAHNALWAYGKRTNAFSLPRLKDCHDYAVVVEIYQEMVWPNLRIVLTGTGRVAGGARRTLLDMGIEELSPAQFLENNTPEKAVFTQLSAAEYVMRKDKSDYEKHTFYTQPDLFETNFAQYAANCDIFINGIFWNAQSPAFFSLGEMKDRELLACDIIADITCDIAPESSVPSTLRPSTIAAPLYGVNRYTNAETAPFDPDSITVMAIDNLPNELPRDATAFFGEQFIANVLPEFLKPQSEVLQRACIASAGKLEPPFRHLALV